MNKKSQERLSKFLSYILRHNPKEINLYVDPYGWANLKELSEKLSSDNREVTVEDLEEIVRTDGKGRYAISDSGLYIRAVQGHSIPVNLEFPQVEPPKTLYHGTGDKNRDSILKKGIDRQGRLYVHLSGDIETAKKVGSRHGKPIIFSIPAYQMHLDGVKFYLAENGVYLVDYVDPKYLKEEN